MALDTTTLPRYIIRRLNDAGYSNKSIGHLSPEEALEVWLAYEGIKGWAGSIMDMVDKLRESEVKPH